jgi:multisubunit Na+/H+ antiporter MnhC subunit
MELTLNHFLFVSGALFAIGLAGVLVRRNLLIIFMCLELMLAAANLTLVAFSRFNLVEGQPPTTPTSSFSSSSPWRRPRSPSVSPSSSQPRHDVHRHLRSACSCTSSRSAT